MSKPKNRYPKVHQCPTPIPTAGKVSHHPLGGQTTIAAHDVPKGGWTEQDFGDYKFAMVNDPQEFTLLIQTRKGHHISITPEGEVDIKSDTPLSEAAMVFWKVVAACAPIRISLLPNGLAVGQAKLYAIEKIRDMLVKKDYEAARHFAEAVMQGDVDVG